MPLCPHRLFLIYTTRQHIYHTSPSLIQNFTLIKHGRVHRATEVHVRVSAPPVIGQCFYGIDLADPSEMIASTHSIEEIRRTIGATSLAYISHDGLVAATRRPESELCRACLTGQYPTAVPAEHAKLRFEAAPV